jgi:biopolymer transport protein ExbD
MNANGRNKQAVAEINVTPLVDVVLVLLIIFMVMTPLAEKQMFMRVPEYQPPDQVVPAEQIPPDQSVLLVKTDGRVLLNHKDLSVEEAMVTLRGAFEGRLSKVLFLNAEDNVNYERVVWLADQARKAGVNTIGMMTEVPFID